MCQYAGEGRYSVTEVMGSVEIIEVDRANSGCVFFLPSLYVPNLRYFRIQDSSDMKDVKDNRNSVFYDIQHVYENPS